MSRRAKGPRLWLRPARHDAAGTVTHLATWIIRDGQRAKGTGCGAGETKEAERALAAYIDSKHTSHVISTKRDPAFILVDDVLAIYARDIAPKHARPDETAARIKRLAAFWHARRLSEVTGQTCREYARKRGGGARRELEELRAAINYHRREGLHDKIVSVVLPAKPPSRERWLSREEAARLILTAWRHKDDNPFQRRTWRHVAKFMLVARYMGSRAAVICGASIEPKRPAGKPWIDLTTGVFHGRPQGHRDTKKRRQTVRVPDPLLAHLRRWQRLGQRYAVEWRGKPVTRVSKGHAAAVAAAELEPDVTPHTWRHTVASWAMQRGADPGETAEFLAMSYETLIRVYGHFRPNQFASVHAALASDGKRHRTATDNREREGNSRDRSTR